MVSELWNHCTTPFPSGTDSALKLLATGLFIILAMNGLSLRFLLPFVSTGLSQGLHLHVLIPLLTLPSLFSLAKECSSYNNSEIYLHERL